MGPGPRRRQECSPTRLPPPRPWCCRWSLALPICRRATDAWCTAPGPCRCSIAAVSDRPEGFSTRAIRAASRGPRVDQRPSSVPIYQTATFTSADAEELGDVVGDRRAGYAYSRISNPTIQRARRCLRRARRWRGRDGARLGHGRDPRGARVAARARATGSWRRGGLRVDADPADRARSRGSASASISST